MLRPHLERSVLTNMVYRDEQLAYVASVRTPNFGYTYIEIYTYFSLQFLYDFILFKNLLL